MPKQGEVLSHWSILIENFQTSSLAFYDQVEAGVAERKLSNVATERIELNEGGIGSDKRIYLRIKRGKLTFDICGAPFGTGHFFSSWLSEQSSSIGAAGGFLLVVMSIMVWAVLVGSLGFRAGMVWFLGGMSVLLFFVKNGGSDGDEMFDDIMVSIPLIGPVYKRLFMQPTFYRLDTQSMFQSTVHRVVTSVVQELNNAQGLQALQPDELKSTVRDVLK